MLACMDWLAADYLIREGYTITTAEGGMRTAVCEGQSFEIGRACDHADCPPILTKTLERV